MVDSQLFIISGFGKEAERACAGRTLKQVRKQQCLVLVRVTGPLYKSTVKIIFAVSTLFPDEVARHIAPTTAASFSLSLSLSLSLFPSLSSRFLPSSLSTNLPDNRIFYSNHDKENLATGLVEGVSLRERKLAGKSSEMNFDPDGRAG